MAREPFNPDDIRVPPNERLFPSPFQGEGRGEGVGSPSPSQGEGSGEGQATAAKAGSRVPPGPMTVSQVTALVKRAIELALPPTVHVVGELSNFKRHSSGHLYFTLKDSFSELSCVMWRSAAESLRFAPADGLEVIATGGVEVFERAGRYQLYVRKLEPRGIGALELAFRQLCEKLAREGLFDPTHKKPLPKYPRRIAIVTSPTGAAIADMLRTIERRYPCVEVFLFPVRVQGPGAAPEIAAAIAKLNRQAAGLGGIDLMIVGRGGGSLEDLWAFNEEIVARAIFASGIPVVSAVGHEVDVTIADLVADVRAATPTAAAEIAVPVLDELLADLADHESRLLRAARHRLELLTSRVDGLAQRGLFREPLQLVRRREQSVDELTNRLHRALVERLRLSRTSLERVEPTLQRIAPHRVLRDRALALGNAEHRLRWAIRQGLSSRERTLLGAEHRLAAASPSLAIPRHTGTLDRLSQVILAAIRHRLTVAGEHVRRQDDVLAAMSYKSVLGRGFSIIRNAKGRTVIRSVQDVRDGQRLVSELADGEFESQVVNRQQLELFE